MSDPAYASWRRIRVDFDRADAWHLACEYFTATDGQWIGNLRSVRSELYSDEEWAVIRRETGGRPDDWVQFENVFIRTGGPDGTASQYSWNEFLDLLLVVRLVWLGADYLQRNYRLDGSEEYGREQMVGVDFFSALLVVARSTPIFLTFKQEDRDLGRQLPGTLQVMARTRALFDQPLPLWVLRDSGGRCAQAGPSTEAERIRRLRQTLRQSGRLAGVILHEIGHRVAWPLYGLSTARSECEGPDLRTWRLQVRGGQVVGARIYLPQSCRFAAGYYADPPYPSRHWLLNWLGTVAGGWLYGGRGGAMAALIRRHADYCSAESGYRPEVGLYQPGLSGCP